MRNFKFFTFAATGMLLASCSSDSVVDNNEQGTVTNGYIAVGINLPTQPSTRSTTDQSGTDLDDGLADEYAVHDASLIIFDGTTKLFKAAYKLDLNWPLDKGDDHVTETSTKFVKKVGNTKVGDLLLVVLNNNDLIEVVSENELKVNKTKFTGTYEAFCKTKVNTKELYAVEMTGNGIFMVNAPLADAPGDRDEAGTVNVQTLVPISAVYPTEDEARSSKADQIYVERGVAKVTVNQVTGDPSFSKLSTLKYKLKGWTLDNTNKTSFYVRSTEGYADFAKLKTKSPNKSYRYTGNVAITAGTPSPYKYRTYFAKDNNYGEAANLISAGKALADYKTKFGSDNPQYCYENTFNVANQTERNTTLARIAVQAIPDGKTEAVDLYTIDGSKSEVIEEATLITKIQNEAYKLVTHPGTAKSADITVTLGDEDRGEISIASITLPSEEGWSAPEGLVETVKKNLGEIVKYKDGISYYTIRIKHFGDDLTPWNKDEFAEGHKPAAGKIYPEGADSRANDNYLGRYGVLRNNWYDLNITGIKYLGMQSHKTPKTLLTMR